MKLCELKTPFCRSRIITCARDHTTAVVKKRELQQVGGYLYKDKNIMDSYGQVTCRLYVYYPEAEIGIDAGSINHPDDRTVENVMSLIPSAFLESPQAAIADLDYAAANNEWIANTQVELARHIAPEKVDRYIEAQQRHRVALDKKCEEKQKKKAMEEAAFCKGKNEESQKQIDKAIEIICGGGVLEADCISIYHSRYDRRTYNIINHLARMYDVEIPLKVQGWINSKLLQVTISDGRATSMRHIGHTSKTFWGYMEQLIQAVCKEEERKHTAA